MEGFIRVAGLGDVPEGTLLGIELEGHRICLANSEGEIYAFRDNCTHKDFPLSAGELEDTEVTCDWHGARFDVRSGQALCLPAVRPVQTYEVKIEGEEIWVRV
jgi:3-phenylpropionate/trans-cinnamate dioxygenase ferredoxin component